MYEFRLDLTLLEFQAEFEVWDKLNSLSQIDTIFIGLMTVSIADSFCCCCVFRLDLTICVVDKFTLKENLKTFQMEMLISNPMQLYGLLI